MSQPLDANGAPIEQRAQSAASTTECIPSGTLLNVPSVPPHGPVPAAPIVGANTVPWKTDAQFLISTIGLPVVTAVLEYLNSPQGLKGFDGHTLLHIALSAAVGALLGYLRKTTNTVAR